MLPLIRRTLLVIQINNKSIKVGTTFSWAQKETGGGKGGQVIQVSNKHN